MIKFPNKEKFVHQPTPIIPVKRYFTDRPSANVWLKRDDLTGIELSGNKIRKLQYLLSEALEQQTERVITCGGIQSNHCRATAFAAAQLGLNCTLFLRGTAEKPARANHFLDQLAGAEIHYVTAEEYREIEPRMSSYGRNFTEKCYVIPEGGSNEVGMWGYIETYVEIVQQAEAAGLQFDAVVVATGSGGTHAGLLAAKQMTGAPLRVISFNVCDDSAFFKTKIMRITGEFKRKYEIDFPLDEADIEIVDGFTGPGYGIITEDEVRIVREFARSEGIVLDPVYGAKAFRGFAEYLRAGKFPVKNSLFIHTGGIFGVLPYADQFA